MISGTNDYLNLKVESMLTGRVEYSFSMWANYLSPLLPSAHGILVMGTTNGNNEFTLTWGSVTINDKAYGFPEIR